MRLGGVVCAAVALAVAMLPAILSASGGATGPLSDTDETSVLTAVLADQWAAHPGADRRYLVDGTKQLTQGQRDELHLWFPAPWVRIEAVDLPPRAERSLLVDTFYPLTVSHGLVTVDVSTICGRECASTTHYRLKRSGGSWWIVDQRTVQAA
jgi:hypothetical protein